MVPSRQVVGPKWWRTSASLARPTIAWTPARRIAAGHAVALLPILAVLAVDVGVVAQPSAQLIGIALVVAFAALRAASVGSRLATGALALDAVGTAILMSGTSAPASPYFSLAVVGAWWAAHIPRRGGGLLWSAAFVVTYAALVVPDAIRDRMLVLALEEGSVVVIVGLLSDRLVRVNERALLLNEAMQAAPFDGGQLAMREALARSLRTMDVPVDVVLAAGQLGLTAIQAELLAYLVLGLSNLEIADATGISEAAVRYRLTRLYRTLGVIGRREARRRAIELGIRGRDPEQVSAGRS